MGLFNKKNENEEKQQEEVPGTQIQEQENESGDKENETPEIEVIVVDNMIRIEDGERYVEGGKKPKFGQKRKMKNFMRPNKMTVKGADDPVEMYLDDYSLNKDLDLYILDKMLTDWSKKEKITWSNILDDTEVGDLMEKFADKFKEINDLKGNRGNEKKQEEEKN